MGALEGASEDAVIAAYQDATGLSTDATDARQRILAAVAMLLEALCWGDTGDQGRSATNLEHLYWFTFGKCNVCEVGGRAAPP